MGFPSLEYCTRTLFRTFDTYVYVSFFHYIIVCLLQCFHQPGERDTHVDNGQFYKAELRILLNYPKLRQFYLRGLPEYTRYAKVLP